MAGEAAQPRSKDFKPTTSSSEGSLSTAAAHLCLPSCTFHTSCCCGQTALRLLRSTPAREFNPPADNREDTHLLLFGSCLPLMEPFPSSTGACWRGPEIPLPRPSAPVWRLGASLQHPLSHCVLPSFLQLANSGHPAARQLSAPPPLLLPSCWQPLRLLITHKHDQLHSISSTQAPACKMSMSRSQNSTQGGRPLRGHSCFLIWVSVTPYHFT